MISIVTAYYNRKNLFIRTLKSIQAQNFSGEYEVIAVDDGSDKEERLEDLISEFPFLKIIRLEKENKWYKNSCIPFNIGFKAAKGDKIIIQNPECYHYSPILQYVEDHLNENMYLSFGCFSLAKKETENLDNLINKDEINNLINRNNHIVERDGDNGWYNHSVFRPKSYHFCTAISRNDLLDLGGFDERYAHGIGVDDDEIIFRIKLKRMAIVFVDEVFVLHQNHYINSPILNTIEIRKIKDDLYADNLRLFNQITKKNIWWRTGYLPGQETLSNNVTNDDARMYQNVLLRQLLNISQSRVKRKVSRHFLQFLSSL